MLPVKLMEGFAADPADAVKIPELAVLLVVLNTLVPSQMQNAVAPFATATVLALPPAAVLKVSVYAFVDVLF